MGRYDIDRRKARALVFKLTRLTAMPVAGLASITRLGPVPRGTELTAQAQRAGWDSRDGCRDRDRPAAPGESRDRNRSPPSCGCEASIDEAVATMPGPDCAYLRLHGRAMSSAGSVLCSRSLAR